MSFKLCFWEPAFFFLLEKAIVYSLGWAGREAYSHSLTPPSSSLPSNLQPQKLYLNSPERRYMPLSLEDRSSKMLGGKPDSLVLLTNSQGDSDWVSLVQAACDQVCFPLGTSVWIAMGRNWFLSHVSEIRLIPLTWPNLLLAYQIQAWNCS